MESRDKSQRECGRLIDPDRTVCLCDVGAPDYLAAVTVDANGEDTFWLACKDLVERADADLGDENPPHEKLGRLPHTVREWEKVLQVRRLFAWNMEGAPKPRPELHAAFPYFRHGYLSHLRGAAVLVETLLPGDSHFHAAYPATLSSDVLHLGARIRAARSKGTLDRLDIPPALMAKKKEFDQLQADMPQHLAAFFERLVNELGGRRVYISATWTLLHNMAQAGLARGLEGVFAPDSYLSTTGGAKGVPQPPGWKEDLLRFTGAKRLIEAYSMSEVLASHMRCEHGHFHFEPTTIPYLLDPETSKPLPRRGR